MLINKHTLPLCDKGGPELVCGIQINQTYTNITY